jgi:heme/copper-type cytochrome/quinol oxidase subunit 2
MNFSVLVVSPEAYDEYIEGLQADPNNAILTETQTAAAGSSQ